MEEVYTLTHGDGIFWGVFSSPEKAQEFVRKYEQSPDLEWEPFEAGDRSLLWIESRSGSNRQWEIFTCQVDTLLAAEEKFRTQANDTEPGA